MNIVDHAALENAMALFVAKLRSKLNDQSPLIDQISELYGSNKASAYIDVMYDDESEESAIIERELAKAQADDGESFPDMDIEAMTKLLNSDGIAHITSAKIVDPDGPAGGWPVVRVTFRSISDMLTYVANYNYADELPSTVDELIDDYGHDLFCAFISNKQALHRIGMA